MSEQRGGIREVAWQEVFPGLREMFSALHMAMNFRALLLAAVALIGTSAGWRLLGDVFHSPETAPASTFDHRIDANRAWPWELGVVPRDPEQFLSLDAWYSQNPILFVWNEISAPVKQVYASGATFTQVVYWLSCSLWALLVWSFFGGAITRMAAVGIARGENLSWGELAGFVRRRIGSYFAAPLFPMIGTLLLAVFLAVVGLMLRVDLGVLVAGILWPIVLLVGFMMAFLLIGLYFSWPLMWSAISTEGTDAFGALSHAYSYTYQRPLHYLLYTLVAGVIGVLGWFLVSLFAEWILILSHWGVAWGSGSARMADIINGTNLGSLGETGRTLILFWHHMIWTLALAFLFSYFWTSTTVSYFLLRRLVDATEIDEVYLSDDPTTHTLPPLKSGPTVVPEVMDAPPQDG